MSTVPAHVVANNKPSSGKPNYISTKPMSLNAYAAAGLFVGLMAALGASVGENEPQIIYTESARPAIVASDASAMEPFQWHNEDPAKRATREAEIAARDSQAYRWMGRVHDDALDAEMAQRNATMVTNARIDSTRLAIQASQDRLRDIQTASYVKAVERAAEAIRTAPVAPVYTPAPVNVTVTAPRDDRMIIRGPVVGVVPYGGSYAHKHKR